MSLALQMASYAAVVTLGAASPGPDFAVVTRYAALSGRIPGVAAAAGVATGMAVNTALAIAGVGALVAASQTLYTAVKLIGAAYLVYLAIRILLSLRQRGSDETAPADEVLDRRGLWTAYRHGLFANFLNPKVVVFLVTLMPQFLPQRPTLTEQILFGVISVVAVLNWFSIVAVTVGTFRRAFRRRKVRNILNGVTGGVLLLVAARIALS
ncbi:LysE family translocator [Actinoplanes sp. NPDC023801]|uniref:LysE family translocator n=1 Tax=Actinoplanes sp. NPDC023801 TaxID=3154595 RepID=UPI0033E5E80C